MKKVMISGALVLWFAMEMGAIMSIPSFNPVELEILMFAFIFTNTAAAVTEPEFEC